MANLTDFLHNPVGLKIAAVVLVLIFITALVFGALLRRQRRSLEHLQDIPLLVVHGEINELHPVAEPISLLAKYPGTIYFKKSLIFPNTQMWICYEIQDKLMYTGCHKVVTQSGCWTIMKNFRMSFEMSMYGPRASRIAKDTQFF